jgi:hypothetical protein
MAQIIRVKPGIITAQDGTYPELRGARKGGLVSQDVGSRFEEATYRGVVFSSPLTVTAITNATFTTADATSATLATAATSTPICGIYNPYTSTVNAVVLQAVCSMVMTALQATGTGPLVWVAYTGQTSALTTAVVPFNRKTMLQSGAQAKGLPGVALTGLNNTGNIVAASALSIPMYNTALLGTAVGFQTPAPSTAVENIDGSFIVPPGAILGLFATTTPVAISVASSIMWEEIPL